MPASAAARFMITKGLGSRCYNGNWRVRTFWVCGVMISAGIGDQGADDSGGLVGDGGLVLPGAVEGVHLERGVDTRPQFGGGAGEQAGRVGQFIDQGGVFGGALVSGEDFQFGLGGGLLVEPDSELLVDPVALRDGGRGLRVAEVFQLRDQSFHLGFGLVDAAPELSGVFGGAGVGGGLVMAEQAALVPPAR